MKISKHQVLSPHSLFIIGTACSNTYSHRFPSQVSFLGPTPKIIVTFESHFYTCNSNPNGKCDYYTLEQYNLI